MGSALYYKDSEHPLVEYRSPRLLSARLWSVSEWTLRPDCWHRPTERESARIGGFERERLRRGVLTQTKCGRGHASDAGQQRFDSRGRTLPAVSADSLSPDPVVPSVGHTVRRCHLGGRARENLRLSCVFIYAAAADVIGVVQTARW